VSSAISGLVFDARTRVRVGALLLLVSTSFLATVGDLITVVRYPPRKIDDRVLKHEARMARARESLPTRGVVGYVSDVDGMELRRRLYMTQYALAPLLIVQDVKRDIILGDFTRFPSADYRAAGFKVLNDLGDGLVLLTPAKP